METLTGSQVALSTPLLPVINEDEALDKSATKRTREDWEQLISSWKKSGLTQKDFSATQQIKVHTFVYHRNRQLQSKRSSKKLIPVKVNSLRADKPSDTRLIMQLPSGTKLFIPQHYDKDSLKNILTILGVC